MGTIYLSGDQTKLGNLFRAVVPSKNFMTPTVLGYAKIKNKGIAELSSGVHGADDKTIYSVTVVIGDTKNDELSLGGLTFKEAIKHLKSLGAEFTQ